MTVEISDADAEFLHRTLDEALDAELLDDETHEEAQRVYTRLHEARR